MKRFLAKVKTAQKCDNSKVVSLDQNTEISRESKKMYSM